MTSNDQNPGPWGNRKGEGTPWGNIKRPDFGKGKLPPTGDLFGKIPGGFKGLFGILAVLWLLSGVYKVAPDEQGVVTRFGKWVGTTQSGLNYHLPFPIEAVEKPKVTRINKIDITDETKARNPRQREGAAFLTLDTPERLILTGDEQLITVNFNVLWKISDAGKFLFNVRNQEATIEAAAESAMREAVGQTVSTKALAEERREIERRVQESLQKILQSYDMGVEVTEVNMQKADPPSPVIDAFLDVQRARADKDRMERMAEGHRNSIVPEARGEAEKMLQEALGYKQSKIAQAQGDAARFDLVYAQYVQAKGVTARRLYFDTMQEILQGASKIVTDQGGQGIVPYLPLGKLEPQEPAPSVTTAKKE